jgi:hypothetical protein
VSRDEAGVAARGRFGPSLPAASLLPRNPRRRGPRLHGLRSGAGTCIPRSILMIFGGVIGFAPGFLQYKYPLSGTSTKGRPEV